MFSPLAKVKKLLDVLNADIGEDSFMVFQRRTSRWENNWVGSDKIVSGKE